jgi:hypothetical protein
MSVMSKAASVVAGTKRQESLERSDVSGVAERESA